MSTDEDPLIEVENGLFFTKSIVGDEFCFVPKDFYPEQLKQYEYRKDHVTVIMSTLQALVKTGSRNNPGLYLQGPAGVGKSVLVYTITQIAKFNLKWLTVYLPDCAAWSEDGDVAAVGYFLDRVLDALSIVAVQNEFQGIWQMLKGPIDI